MANRSSQSNRFIVAGNRSWEVFTTPGKEEESRRCRHLPWLFKLNGCARATQSRELRGSLHPLLSQALRVHIGRKQ